MLFLINCKIAILCKTMIECKNFCPHDWDKGRQGSVLWLDLEEKSLLSEIYFMPVLCRNFIQIHFILDITK